LIAALQSSVEHDADKAKRMLAKMISIVIISFVAVIGFALIRGGQYLHKEKFFKSGLREGLHNTTIDAYPEHREGKKLLVLGQILIALDLLAIIILYLSW
jgi:uncharacterized membrane protein YjgN (DUF898 family)